MLFSITFRPIERPAHPKMHMYSCSSDRHNNQNTVIGMKTEYTYCLPDCLSKSISITCMAWRCAVVCCCCCGRSSHPIRHRPEKVRTRCSNLARTFWDRMARKAESRAQNTHWKWKNNENERNLCESSKNHRAKCTFTSFTSVADAHEPHSLAHTNRFVYVRWVLKCDISWASIIYENPRTFTNPENRLQTIFMAIEFA